MLVYHIDRRFNEPRLIPNHIRMYIRRKLGPQFVEPVLDDVCHLNRVRPGLFPNEKRNCRFSVLPRKASRFLVSVFHFRDVTKVNGSTLDCGDNELLEVTNIFNPTQGSQTQLIRALIEATAWN